MTTSPSKPPRKWRIVVPPETFAWLEAYVEERCQRTRSATDDDRAEEARRCLRQTRALYEGKVPGLRVLG